MNDSPNDSPNQPRQNQFVLKPGSPEPVTWAFIGFAVGTLVVAPFILSVDMRNQLLGGAISGGTLGSLIGLSYGVSRSRKSHKPEGISDLEHAQACPMCGATSAANASRCRSCGERLDQQNDMGDDSEIHTRQIEPWWNRIPSAVGFAIILGLLAVVLIFRFAR